MITRLWFRMLSRLYETRADVVLTHTCDAVLRRDIDAAADGIARHALLMRSAGKFAKAGD